MNRKIFDKVRIPVIFIIFGLTAEISLLSADEKTNNTFQQKCSKCHSLKNPNKYSKKEWKYNVERMAQRAGLNKEEIDSIIKMNKK